MSNLHLGYDPGIIPILPAPVSGETLLIQVPGLPPYKNFHFSIRNSAHRIYHRFMTLRKAAVEAMNGRACYNGAIELNLTVSILSSERERKKYTALDYCSGVMDSLGGSSGMTFAYLPIVYQDDCQLPFSSRNCSPRTIIMPTLLPLLSYNC